MTESEAKGNAQNQKPDAHFIKSPLPVFMPPAFHMANSPLQFMDLLGQDTLLCLGQVSTAPQLSHFLPVRGLAPGDGGRTSTTKGSRETGMSM